jgi:hypothetical protein
VDASFELADISLLSTNPGQLQEFRAARGGGVFSQGTTAGTIAGASAGLATVALAGSGFELLAAGPILSALQGMRAGAAPGGLVGVLAGLGYWKAEADIPAAALEKGAILVGVHVPGARMGEAAEVLRACGADLVQVN